MTLAPLSPLRPRTAGTATPVREAGAGGHWVTLNGDDEGSGVHVFLSGAGRVEKGPRSLLGGHIGDISRHSSTTSTQHHPPGHEPPGARSHPQYAEHEPPPKPAPLPGKPYARLHGAAQTRQEQPKEGPEPLTKEQTHAGLQTAREQAKAAQADAGLTPVEKRLKQLYGDLNKPVSEIIGKEQARQIASKAAASRQGASFTEDVRNQSDEDLERMEGKRPETQPGPGKPTLTPPHKTPLVAPKTAEQDKADYDALRQMAAATGAQPSHDIAALQAARDTARQHVQEAHSALTRAQGRFNAGAISKARSKVDAATNQLGTATEQLTAAQDAAAPKATVAPPQAKRDATPATAAPGGGFAARREDAIGRMQDKERRSGGSYRVLGTSDDQTTCEICGKKDLKKTVALHHDQSGEIVRAGSDCAAELLRTSRSSIEKAAQRHGEKREEAFQKALETHPNQQIIKNFASQIDAIRHAGQQETHAERIARARQRIADLTAEARRDIEKQLPPDKPLPQTPKARNAFSAPSSESAPRVPQDQAADVAVAHQQAQAELAQYRASKDRSPNPWAPHLSPPVGDAKDKELAEKATRAQMAHQSVQTQQQAEQATAQQQTTHEQAKEMVRLKAETAPPKAQPKDAIKPLNAATPQRLSPGGGITKEHIQAKVAAGEHLTREEKGFVLNGYRMPKPKPEEPTEPQKSAQEPQATEPKPESKPATPREEPKGAFAAPQRKVPEAKPTTPAGHEEHPAIAALRNTSGYLQTKYLADGVGRPSPEGSVDIKRHVDPIFKAAEDAAPDHPLHRDPELVKARAYMNESAHKTTPQYAAERRAAQDKRQQQIMHPTPHEPHVAHMVSAAAGMRPDQREAYLSSIAEHGHGVDGGTSTTGPDGAWISHASSAEAAHRIARSEEARHEEAHRQATHDHFDAGGTFTRSGLTRGGTPPSRKAVRATEEARNGASRQAELSRLDVAEHKRRGASAAPVQPKAETKPAFTAPQKAAEKTTAPEPAPSHAAHEAELGQRAELEQHARDIIDRQRFTQDLGAAHPADHADWRHLLASTDGRVALKHMLNLAEGHLRLRVKEPQNALGHLTRLQRLLDENDMNTARGPQTTHLMQHPLAQMTPHLNRVARMAHEADQRRAARGIPEPRATVQTGFDPAATERLKQDSERAHAAAKGAGMEPTKPAGPAPIAERPKDFKKAAEGARPHEMSEGDFIAQQHASAQKQAERSKAHYERELAEMTPKVRAGNRGQMAEGSHAFWSKQLEGWPQSPTQKRAEEYRATYAEHVKKALSKGHPVPEAVIAQRPEFRKAQDARARYDKGRHTSFANESIAVNRTGQQQSGYKVKRQDGKPIPAHQVAEIERGMQEIQGITGPLTAHMRANDLTIAHLNGKHPFMSAKASAMYHGGEQTISHNQGALAHEMAHYLDHHAGKAQGVQKREYTSEGHLRGTTSYLSDRDAHFYDSKDPAARELHRYAERHMTKTHVVKALMKANGTKDLAGDEKTEALELKARLGSYWREPREVFARLVEQYVAHRLGQGGVSAESPAFYHETPAWWSKEHFEHMRPEVERQIARRLEAMGLDASHLRGESKAREAATSQRPHGRFVAPIAAAAR